MGRLRHNIVVRFSVISFVVLAAIAATLVYALSAKIRSDAVQDLVDEAIGASAGRLLTAVAPSDFQTPMTGERYDQFHEFVQRSIVSDRTARIKLWSTDGTVIYSNDPAGVGEKFPAKENLLRALRGESAVEIKIPEDAENARERFLGTLMEVYSPVIYPGSTAPQGVLEIYQYYEPTAQRINDLMRWVVGSVAGGFLILYGGLVSIVWSGGRTITRQRERLEWVNAELQNKMDEAKASNQQLLFEITERRSSGELLRESNRQLEEALNELERTQHRIVQQERLRALGQMASGIAHDFNNTLLPIVGYTELLLMDPKVMDDRERAVRYLNTVRTAANDAANVVKRLREFYRSRDEEESFDLVDVNAIVRQVINLTQPKWKDQAQARGGSIDVETDLHETPELPGDESALRDALTNLILNAADAMPDGGTITIRSLKEGDDMVVQVSDTGMGMSEEVRRRCLEPFFTTKGEQGTGLGLSMVHGIIQRHKGSVYSESTPGQGTTFILRLPIRQPVRKPSEPTPQEEAASTPLRILVVDDDATSLMVIADSLETDGHTVDTAATARDALERFRSGAYDVVFTDRAMPDMNGDQVADAIKHVSPDTPVIMLTGFGDVMKYSGQKPASVDLVGSKPATLADLRSMIAKVRGGVAQASAEGEKQPA